MVAVSDRSDELGPGGDGRAAASLPRRTARARGGHARRLNAAAAILALLAPAARADSTSLTWLYEGRAIVTGTDDRQRGEGFARCLRDVLVKVSGNPDLLADPRVASLDSEARADAEDFTYQDRMTDVPMHDEQGTRDRPYDLAVRFAPARIHHILDELGERVWDGPRPPLALRVTLSRNGLTIPLTADGLPDERPREAAIAAGARYGLRVLLPPIEANGTASEAPPPLADAVLLTGALVFRPETFGWTADWTLASPGGDRHWHIEGVSFDEAFRDGLRGSIRVLSGHAAGDSQR